jgi:hypothetical protein
LSAGGTLCALEVVLMPSTRRRTVLIAVIAFAVAGGCTGQPATPAATAPVATTTSAPNTPAPGGSGPGPLTTAERAWLAAIPTFMDKVEQAFSQENVRLTPMKLREFGNLMHGCRAALARGLPGPRLRPVLAQILTACAEYEKGARCFATAARLGAVAAPTPAEDRTYRRAIDCGFAAQGKGLTSLADAFNTGEKIKIAAQTGR